MSKEIPSARMNEDSFVEIIAGIVKKRLPEEYIMTIKENLLYKIFLDNKGNIVPAEIKNPKRGQYSFQTDLLIKKGNSPVIVIEAKYGSLTTHDILTYSNKALKHKEVYPHIRYGLLVGNMEFLPKRFFTHNTGFDFAYATKNLSNLKTFEEIIIKQITTYETLIEVYSKNIQNFETIVNTNFINLS